MGRTELSVDETIRRARRLFPHALPERLKFKTNAALKRHLAHYIQHKLYVMGIKREEHLKKQSNAKEFCIAIGIEESLVERKFLATAAIERHLGIKNKLPIVESVIHLVNTIDMDNPTNEATDTFVPNYKGKDWCMYLGVSLSLEDNLNETIESIEQTIRETLKDDSNTCFMQGTTAAVMKGVLEENGYLRKPEVKGSHHDFGRGFY